MPDRQPFGDRHAWSDTYSPDQRPTDMPSRRHIGDRQSTCLIKDPPETDVRHA